MAKAILILQNETQATIEGTSEEIAHVMKLYSDNKVTNIPRDLSKAMTSLPGKSANTIKLQVAALLTYFVISLAVLSVAGYGMMKSLTDSVFSLYFDGLLPSIQLEATKSALYQIQGDFDRFMLVPDSRNESEQAIATDLAKISKNMAAFRSGLLHKEDMVGLAEFDKNWTAYQNIINASMAQVKTGEGQATIQNSAIINAHTEVLKVVENLSVKKQDAANIIKDEADTTFVNSVTMITAIAVIEGLIGISLGFLCFKLWQARV